MPGFKQIDLSSWPRRTHWNYYRNIVKAAVSMTSKIDVTKLLEYCHAERKPFSAVFLYYVCKTVNSLDSMKMFADENGNPCVWDTVHPNFTVFHEDDETFSDVWIEYNSGINVFVEGYIKIISEYKDRKGIKVRDNQPPNFFPVSCIPWISFESFNSYTAGANLPALFPILNYGKYEKAGDKYTLPLSISVSHAAMDGYHLAKFFNTLQNNIDSIQ